MNISLIAGLIHAVAAKVTAAVAVTALGTMAVVGGIDVAAASASAPIPILQNIMTETIRCETQNVGASFDACVSVAAQQQGITVAVQAAPHALPAEASAEAALHNPVIAQQQAVPVNATQPAQATTPAVPGAAQSEDSSSHSGGAPVDQQSVESVHPSEPAQAAEKVQPPDPTETVDAAEPTKVVEQPEPTQAAEKPQAPQPTEVVKQPVHENPTAISSSQQNTGDGPDTPDSGNGGGDN